MTPRYHFILYFLPFPAIHFAFLAQFKQIDQEPCFLLLPDVA